MIPFDAMLSQLHNSKAYMKKLRSFSLFKHIVHKMQWDYMDLLVRSLLSFITQSHKNYFAWKGQSWRREAMVLAEVRYDCAAFLSYDHDGDVRLLALVDRYVAHKVSAYMRDREALFLLPPQDGIIEYDAVPDEKNHEIHVPNLYERKTEEENEEELANALLMTEKDENMAHVPVPSKSKIPSRKFKDLESLKIIKKALNLEFFKTKATNQNKIGQNGQSIKDSSKPYQLQSKRSRSLNILPSLHLEDINPKKNTTFEKGSIEEFNSTFSKRRNKIFSESPMEKQRQKELHRSTSISELGNDDDIEVDSPRNFKMRLGHFFNLQMNNIPAEDLTTLKNSFEKRGRNVSNLRDHFKIAFFEYLESKNLKSLEIDQIAARNSSRNIRSFKKSSVIFNNSRRRHIYHLMMIDL